MESVNYERVNNYFVGGGHPKPISETKANSVIITPSLRKHVVLFGLLFLAGALLAVFYMTLKTPCNSKGFRKEWIAYKIRYGKEYSSAVEDEIRFWTFVKNKRDIEQHNAMYIIGSKSYMKGINQFSDLTAEEVQAMNGFRGRPVNSSGVFVQVEESDDVVDWRTKNVVTGVKNQGLCGSCWAFSATGSLEGQHALKSGSLVSLSEQNLVDCSSAEGNMGCNGGLMVNAFDYIQKNGGIDTELAYPYEGLVGDCRFDPSAVGATVTGFQNIPTFNEMALQNAVSTIGPISAAIQVTDNFMHYQQGVFHDPTCSPIQLNHGVLVVGYGSDKGQDYWLVKNSWGPEWGEQGYIRMSRNRNNNCGIASMASYPLV